MTYALAMFFYRYMYMMSIFVYVNDYQFINYSKVKPNFISQNSNPPRNPPRNPHWRAL